MNGEDLTLNYPLANLALRQPTRASSVAAEDAISTAAAVNGAKQGAASFRSNVEDSAWWQVDLGRIVGIGRVQLWSAERAPLRGVPFLPVALLVSQDGTAWETLAQLHRPFGGALTQRPASLEFSQGVDARFVRLQGVGRGCLQFDELEAFRFVPASRDSSAASIQLGRDGQLDRIEVKPRHDAGFFSVMSVILAEIIYYRRGGLDTYRIEDKDIFRKFKNAPDDSALSFMVERSCWDQEDAQGMARRLPRFGARGRHSPNSLAYKDIDHEAMRYFVERYFQPSPLVRELIEKWTKKYEIHLDDSLVVYFRGTDKATEIKPASFEDFADQAARILAKANGKPRIIVQTDQQQFLDFMSARFPGRVTAIEEIPVTTGTVGMHYLDLTAEFGVSRHEFGLRMFTVVAWLSQARWLLTSSGNVGFWLALLRGHGRGLYQFHPHTQALIEPADAPGP